MNKKEHVIKNVAEGSIASELGIEPGDILISVNGNEIQDVFDYQFQINDENLEIVIAKPNGEEWEFEIEKEYNEDLGIDFSEGLMDKYRTCRNKCVFCFIDQNPKGMRNTIYFKDDDSRLSFLQGNYITLTNMKDEDIDRIIRYKLDPINISVHTTNKELRVKMLKNRFAGEALDKIKRLYDGQIEMNSQIVLCKGINDGAELERSIKDLSEYWPYMKSLSVVPVGLSKHREGLTDLKKFEREDALEVLELITSWQEKLLKKIGTRFVHASDEWFLTSGLPIPEADYYEGYGQIENGVGMVRSLIEEFSEYFDTLQGDNRTLKLSMATGVLAAPTISQLAERMTEKYPNIEIHVYTIINEFYGKDITVAGLLTGQDIIKQLKGQDLGEFLILPHVLLRTDTNVLLDDLSIDDIEKALQIPIRIVKSDGQSFIDTILSEEKNPNNITVIN